MNEAIEKPLANSGGFFYHISGLGRVYGSLAVPANLTPDYMKAEKWFKSASTNEEKILALEEMLRVIPKHKGTEHMQGDIRRRLSKLKEGGAKKGGVKHADIFHVPKSGAGQIALLGTPNSGKSSIVAALTNANVTIGEFPYATSAPVPGMVKFEDIQIELVDMPPITAEIVAPGQVGTYRNCDLIGLVVDLSADVGEQLDVLLDFLESRNLLVPGGAAAAGEHGSFSGKPAFCICTKSDIAKEGAFETSKSKCPYAFEFLKVSTETFEGVEELPAKFFEMLKIMRIYAKPPGKEADMDEPFVLPAGATVMDLAQHIHRQLAEKLKSARCWGADVHPGQNVQRTHVLHDKDIVELHFA